MTRPPARPASALPPVFAFALALAASGCAASDPDRAEGMWQPSGANAGNLAAMAARPQDLVLGRGRPAADARMGADAIDRLWLDRAKPLGAGGASAGGGTGSSKGSN